MLISQSLGLSMAITACRIPKAVFCSKIHDTTQYVFGAYTIPWRFQKVQRGQRRQTMPRR